MNSMWKWIEEGGVLKIKFFSIQEIICSYFKIESLTPVLAKAKTGLSLQKKSTIQYTKKN